MTTTVRPHVPGEQDEHDEVMYGFFHVDDPRDFMPDEEGCSPEEIAAHAEACEKAARGEPWGPHSEEHGPWSKPGEKTVIGERPEGDGWVGGCHAVRSFGIGTYFMHWDQEDGGHWADLQSETEAIDGDQVL